MGLSTEFYQKEVWRAAGFSSVEDFLRRFLEPSFLGMDPNHLLCMAWKWQRGDIARHSHGKLAAALGRIRARTRVIAIDEDMFFPPRDCRAKQGLIPGSDDREVATPTGHLGLFGTDPGYIGQVDASLRELLEEPVSRALGGSREAHENRDSRGCTGSGPLRPGRGGPRRGRSPLPYSAPPSSSSLMRPTIGR